jgi:hypothetical protein
MSRYLLAVGLGFILSLSLVLTSAAAPVDNPFAWTLPGTCDGQEEVSIVITSGLPGHILGSTSVLIPMVFTRIGTLTPEDGPPIQIDETFSDGQKVGLRNALVTCVFPVEYTRSDGAEFVGEFIVEALITPRDR